MSDTKDPRYGRPFLARKAAVASPNNLATVVGNKILQKGGNAVDAMVAVNSTLGVVFPHMTGTGGDAFWLIYDAETDKQYVLNASGQSAKHISLEDYEGQDSIDDRGPRSAITVPGAVGGWYEAHQRFGKLPFATCLESAIEYARNGFPVSESLAAFSEKKLDILRYYPSTAKVFLKDEVSPYMVGEIMKNPDLADTLEEIANKGSEAFYNGSVTDKICNFLEENRGFLEREDFANYKPEWVDPLTANYRGKTVSAPPPNSEGMATIQILGMLDNIEKEKLYESPATFINYFTRATALAFQDRKSYLADPAFYDVPTDKLTSDAYLANRADKLVHPMVSSPEEKIDAEGDTTFSCAVDEDGNAVGVIQSLYWEWGSGLVAEDTGILLQNRGTYFSLDPDLREKLEPEKRPGHTLTTSMVVGDDGPELIVGAMGGDGQPQSQATIMARVIDRKVNVQEAIDEPRWLLGRTWGETVNELRLENRFSDEVLRELKEMGHKDIHFIDGFSDLVGHAQAIQILPDRIEAAADPRANGLALGY
jgi:gamma-glutamyltranspeptidase/glutathione hydrolase